MLPANLISTLPGLSNSGKPVVTATPDASKPVTNLEPGQQWQGAIQSKISEGLFKVQVAGQTLQMRLPGNIQSGDTIKLEVITVQPRITFSIIASTNPLSNPEQIGTAAQLLANSGKTLVAAISDEPPKPVVKLELGQQLQGSVQDKISEGLFKVQVAGQTLQMRLPGNIQSGDTIKLEVITVQPRITFGMIASDNPLSTPGQIGSTARLLSNLAEQPIERPAVQQLGNKAVWPVEQQAPDTKLLAAGLRETLGKSGLFYESHQAQWIRGERSINQLLEEPQNLLTGKASQLNGKALPLSLAGQSAAANNISIAQANTSAPAKSPAEQYAAVDKMTMVPVSPADQHVALDKAFIAQAQTNISAQAKAAGDAAQPIAKELVQMVQQQLHTLEQHHLVWMGQVWPGQQMQWEIQGQPERQSRQQQDERQWSTEMELALPKLGDVHARLMFAESGLRMTLRAADPATVDLFNRALPRLRSSLADAGITLAAAVVEKS